MLTLVREVYLINRFLFGCEVCIEDEILLVDLVELEILEFWAWIDYPLIMQFWTISIMQ